MEMYDNVHKVAVQAQFEQKRHRSIWATTNLTVHDAKVSIQSNRRAVFAMDSNHLR